MRHAQRGIDTENCMATGTGRNANRPSNTSPESSDNEIKPAKGLYANQYLIGDSIKLAVYVSETETWDGAHDLKPIWTHSAVFGGICGSR